MVEINRRQFGKSAAAMAALIARLASPVPVLAATSERSITHAISAEDITSLDPTLAWDSAESPIIPVIMEGLVSYPPGTVSTDFVPALAESWTVSPDRRTYQFHLRKGVQWHEGFGEFTAKDVKFSLDRYRDPDVSPWTVDYDNVVSVDAIDPHTVSVTLKDADPFFLSLVASDTESVGLMVCQKAYQARGAAQMRLHPIGTGPFRFEDYRPKDRVVMVRHDSYWAGRPFLDQVVIRFMPSAASRELALRTGEIDSMRAPIDGLLLNRLKAQGFIIDYEAPEVLWWLHINTRIKPLDDIRVRQAIAHAINPADLEALMGPAASVSTAMIPADYFGAAAPADFPPDLRWTYDPDRARKLLAEAGHPNGIAFSMIISERDDYRQLMVLMQDQMKKVGISVDLKAVDHAYYHSQIVKFTNPLVLYGDITYPNSELLLTRAFRTGATRNFSGWHSPQFDGLLGRITATEDLKQRSALLTQAQLDVAKQFVLVPTVFTRQPLVRNKRVDLGYTLKSSLALEYRFGWRTRLVS